jgi:hypothetical protein
MRAILVVAALTMSVAVAAQEGITTLPKNYTLQFENAWVKVTSVRYGPHEKLPGHTHTPLPAAYVYLNDGGPVIFRHVGGPAATRAATKSGTVRLYRGLEEVHEVENTTATPSLFLRVEFKTEVREPAALRGKFEQPATPGSAPLVHLDHAQVRVSRFWVALNDALTLTTGAEPSLLISLSEQTIGQETWVGPATSVRLKNEGGTPQEYLRFELKTPALTH